MVDKEDRSQKYKPRNNGIREKENEIWVEYK